MISRTRQEVPCINSLKHGLPSREPSHIPLKNGKFGKSSTQMCLFWKRGYVICDRSQKGIPARIWKPTIQRTLQFWWGGLVHEIGICFWSVYCNDFNYTVMHTLFIWFFTSQIIHRHKSTCKQLRIYRTHRFPKLHRQKKGCRSSKTIAQCPFLCSLSKKETSWSASHLVFQDTFEGLHVILLGDSFSQMLADVCHCFRQLHG